MNRDSFFEATKNSIDLASVFWKWWLDELRGLIPEQVRRLSGTRRSLLLIDLDIEAVAVGIKRRHEYRRLVKVSRSERDWDQRVRAALRTAQRKNMFAHIRLASPMVFRKRISLPLVAERNLPQLLAFEIERQIPLKREDVYYDFQIVGRDVAAQQLTVELAVLERATGEEVLEQAKKWGVAVRRIAVASATSEIYEFDFLPAELRSQISARTHRFTAAVWLLAVVLTGLAFLGAVHNQSLARRKLTSELADAKKKAERALILRKEILRAASKERFLPEKREAPRTIEIVAALSHVIPADTWLESLRITRTTVTIVGLSKASSHLIGVLDGSSLFRNAHFESPVTQGAQPNLEHFDISMTLRAGPAS